MIRRVYIFGSRLKPYVRKFFFFFVKNRSAPEIILHIAELNIFAHFAFIRIFILFKHRLKLACVFIS